MSDPDRDSSTRLEKLSRENYTTWMAQVKDIILALDHDDAAEIWTIFEWVSTPGDTVDPIVFDYQNATTAPLRKLKRVHNLAFALIRRHLTRPIFQTTLRLEHSLPKLLRHLRNYWHEHSPNDRAQLTNEYRQMSLSQFADMEEFTSAFQDKVQILREYGIGAAKEDEDILYQLELALPDEWKHIKTIRGAHRLDLT